MTRLLVVSVVGALAMTPASARAHPAVDAAREAFVAAEFERSLSLLDAALERDDLEREDLVELYEIRSLVLYAMEEELEMHRALLALAELAPDRDVPETHPPRWRAAFERARAEVDEEPLAVDVRGSDEGDALVIELFARGDPARLARGWSLTWARDGGEPRNASGGEHRIAWEDSESIGGSATLIGPGGAVIAHEAEWSFERNDGGSPLASPWLWAGIGVAAAAAIVIAIIVAPAADTVIEGARVVPPG